MMRAAFKHLALIVITVVQLSPFLLLVANSFKDSSEFSTNPFGFPTNLTLANIASAWQQGDYGQAYLNSALVGVVCIAVIWLFGGLAAYALAHIPSRRSTALMAYLLFTTSIPLGMFLVPLFFLWQRLHLMNTLYGLIIIYCGIFLAFNVFLLRAYFVGIPKELRESALVEGANDFQVFIRIMAPIARPAFLSVALIVAVWTWNEFYFANAFLLSNQIKTVSVRYLAFTGQFLSDWSLISAAGLISILPLLAVYFPLQRRFIQGIIDGSVKG